MNSLLLQNFTETDFAPIDLSIDWISQQNLILASYESLEHYINKQLSVAKKPFGIGGFLEKRSIYQSSPHFNSSEKERNIHLGIDIWGPSDTPISMPFDGIIHSFAFNGEIQDYGATIITYHQALENCPYLLFGHLSRKDLEHIEVGIPVKKGMTIGHLGDRHDNGGWPPHLHIQVIVDIKDHFGDYPGVCSEVDLAYYKTQVLDPKPYIFK